MAKVAVIVPAAGAGKRFGGRGNKIFQRIGGEQPVFIRTLEAFTGRDDVCQTTLVVAEADLAEVKTRFGANLGFMGVRIATGGATRTESVRNALADLADEAELVAVHDAVRPCVAQPWIDEVFAQAAKTGAAILAYPVHGTLKKVADSRVIDETVPHQDLWVAQTPQVFRKGLLLEAYESGHSATDDAALVEAIGHPVHVVMGDPRNVKITTPADLAFAAAVIKTLPKPKKQGYVHPFEEPKW